MEEKRKFPRVELTTIVRYAEIDTPEEEIEKSIESTSKDISVGGLCIETSGLLAACKLIDIQFFIPRKKSVDALCKVVWSREIIPGAFNAGIQFVKIDENDFNLIKEYIEEG